MGGGECAWRAGEVLEETKSKRYDKLTSWAAAETGSGCSTWSAIAKASLKSFCWYLRGNAGGNFPAIIAEELKKEEVILKTRRCLVGGADYIYSH